MVLWLAHLTFCHTSSRQKPASPQAPHFNHNRRRTCRATSQLITRSSRHKWAHNKAVRYQESAQHGQCNYYKRAETRTYGGCECWKWMTNKNYCIGLEMMGKLLWTKSGEEIDEMNSHGPYAVSHSVFQTLQISVRWALSWNFKCKIIKSKKTVKWHWGKKSSQSLHDSLHCCAILLFFCSLLFCI